MMEEDSAAETLVFQKYDKKTDKKAASAETILQTILISWDHLFSWELWAQGTTKFSSPRLQC